MNIVLIGYRGSGKTTIGRGLAARLGREFVDTDIEIVRKAGKTIREIFEAGGEEAFRDLETAVAAEVGGRDDLVIAAGGGMVLRAENVANLKRGGRIVWLEADARTLYERIRADQTTSASRPNLTAAGGLEEVEALLAQRTPLYEGAAEIRLEVAAFTPDGAVEELLRVLHLAGQN